LTDDSGWRLTARESTKSSATRTCLRSAGIKSPPSFSAARACRLAGLRMRAYRAVGIPEFAA
jgi:hypothetical protein